MAEAKRSIPTIERLTEDGEKFYDVLNDEPEFIQIVVGAAYLDNCLAAMLLGFFIESSIAEKILGPNGRLGSFAARADLCYCLGLINKPIYQDLEKIAQIRNVPAHHHLMIGFDHPDVARLSGELQGGGGFGSLPDAFEYPRNRYLMTCAVLANRLILATMGSERSKRPAGD